MKVKYLQDVNIDTLPISIKNEFEKICFEFSRSKSKPIYLYTTAKKILDFRSDYLLINDGSTKEYGEMYNTGFNEGYLNAEDFFENEPSTENRINIIFSGVHKKLDSLKETHSFIYKEGKDNYVFSIMDYYNYGIEVGKYIKCWDVVLNNTYLFKDIFDLNYLESLRTPSEIPAPKNEQNKMYFKIGLLFAEKKIYSKIVDIDNYKTTQYYYENEVFANPNQLSKHLKLTRQYINDSFNDANTKHNIFKNIKQLKNIVDYCTQNTITIDNEFLNKYLTLIESRK